MQDILLDWIHTIRFTREKVSYLRIRYFFLEIILNENEIPMLISNDKKYFENFFYILTILL